VLNQHVYWIPFRPHSRLELFQFLEGFDVRVRIDCLTCGHHIRQNHSITSVSQKTVIVSFPAEGVVFNFFFLDDCG